MEKTSGARLGEWYAAFKASPLFLGLLVLWVGGCIATHYLWHTDADWGALNLSLSIEATISGALLIGDLARQEAHRRRQEARDRKLLESVLHLLEAHLENTEPE